MSTDKYVFEKSSAEQHMSNTAYENKIWNYINDLNGGQYQNNSLSQKRLESMSTGARLPRWACVSAKVVPFTV